MSRYFAALALGLLAVFARPAQAQDPRPAVVPQVIEAVGGRVAISADGRWLAFDRADKKGRIDLFVRPLAGGPERSLTKGKAALPSLGAGQPEWHPGGRHLVFQVRDPDLQGLKVLGRTTEAILTNPGSGLQNNLWLTDDQGTEFWRLTRVPDRGGVLHPHFSPDGAMLVWAEHQPRSSTRKQARWVLQVADFSMTAAGPKLGETRSHRPFDLDFLEPHSFSPDGRTLLLCGSSAESGYFSLDLILMDLKSGDVRRLTEDMEWDEHAHFSPDGRRIAWATSRDIPQDKTKPDARLDWWVMDVDGSEARRLTWFNEPGHPHAIRKGATASDLAWMPNGQAIIGWVQIVGRRPYSPIYSVRVLNR